MTNKRFLIVLTAIVVFFLIANVLLTQSNKINYNKLDYSEVLVMLNNGFLMEIDDIKYSVGVKSDTEIVDIKNNPLSFTQIKEGDHVYVETLKTEFSFMVKPKGVVATKIIVKE